MTRESRRDSDLRGAREAFCAVRHDPDRLLRWLAWIAYRALLERWGDDGDFVAHGILVEAESWRRGFRPPASFHEANARIRKRRRDGELRFQER